MHTLCDVLSPLTTINHHRGQQSFKDFFFFLQFIHVVLGSLIFHVFTARITLVLFMVYGVHTELKLGNLTMETGLLRCFVQLLGHHINSITKFYTFSIKPSLAQTLGAT